jgi:hypothetical protein
MYRNIAYTGMLLLIFATLLSACADSSTVKIGWICTDGPQMMDCSYRQFTGRKTDSQAIEAGETMQVAYDIVVEAGGLTFSIEDPAGAVIREIAWKDSEQGAISFTAESDGRYRWIVDGDQTQGAFQIEWEKIN